MKVAINGAGISGTALAYWLSHAGHEVCLLERAPGLRTGGYVLNLWGIGYDAVERMGLLPRLLELRYETDELRMVDANGRVRGGYPSKVLSDLARGRIASLARGDIAAAVYDLLDSRVETIFGDSIVAIAEDGAHVATTFESGTHRDFDLVIGADGLHSKVRQCVFGPDAAFEYPLGCHVASFEVQGYQPRDEHWYVAHTAPSRYVAKFPVRNDSMLFFMILRDAYLPQPMPCTNHERKDALMRAFADMGWECPAILAAMGQAGDIYFDSISQIRMDTWAKGRVTLVGDAAACPSLIAGEGAGFALAEAYVLAGEIRRHPTDIHAALASYQARLMPFIARRQRYAEKLVPSFVPSTTRGVRLRDFATRLMRVPVFARLLMGRYLRDETSLPDYA